MTIKKGSLLKPRYDNVWLRTYKCRNMPLCRTKNNEKCPAFEALESCSIKIDNHDIVVLLDMSHDDATFLFSEMICHIDCHLPDLSVNELVLHDFEIIKRSE